MDVGGEWSAAGANHVALWQTLLGVRSVVNSSVTCLSCSFYEKCFTYPRCYVLIHCLFSMFQWEVFYHCSGVVHCNHLWNVLLGTEQRFCSLRRARNAAFIVMHEHKQQLIPWVVRLSQGDLLVFSLITQSFWFWLKDCSRRNICLFFHSSKVRAASFYHL